jgi:hypothetical protein
MIIKHYRRRGDSLPQSVKMEVVSRYCPTSNPAPGQGTTKYAVISSAVALEITAKNFFLPLSDAKLGMKGGGGLVFRG